MNRIRLWMWVVSCISCFAFPSFVGAQIRDVQITLESLLVHDDCDNLSDGDWFVDVRASHSGAPGDIEVAIFPNLHDAANVETGSTVSVNRSVTLRNVPVSNEIEVTINAIDCDSDGTSLGGSFLAPFYFPISRFPSFENDAIETIPNGDCSEEEEGIEASGDHDFVGSAAVRLTPSQWNRGGRFVARPLQSEQCFDGLSFGPTVGILTNPDPTLPKAYTAAIAVRPGNFVIDASLFQPVLDMLLFGFGE